MPIAKNKIGRLIAIQFELELIRQREYRSIAKPVYLKQKPFHNIFATVGRNKYLKIVNLLNNYSQYVGIAAGILTGVSLLPQLIKIIKEKKANSISIGMLAVLLAGLCGWIVYGILKKDHPIIVTNSFSLLTNIIIVVLTAKYKDRS
jgi:MtN3 and saliva related transmembrane protein